jgi:hypothetical protein
VADYTGYLDPSIVNYVQGQGVDPLALSTMGPRGGSTIDPVPPPPPPPPAPSTPKPLPGEISKHIGLFGAPTGGEVPSYGLPPEVVQHIQGAQLAPPLPESPVPSVTGGALPSDASQAVAAPVAAAPDYVAGTAPDMTGKGAVAKANAQYDKRTAAQAAYDASPEGLAAKADNEQRSAVAKEQQANQDALAAEQAQNTATAAALKTSADRQADQDKIDAAKQAEDQANVQKYTQQYAQQVKDAADYKVDTNRDVGVRGLIAIALSGIGNALDHNHGPNAAAQIIESQIDKRIADQWAQKGALKDKANDTKSVLSTFRQSADDDRQAQALHTAAETKRVADEIRQIGAQYANPAAKARAEGIAAQLDQKSALITQGEAVRKADAIKQQREEEDRRTQIGIAGGHLDLARKQFKEGQRQFDNEMDLKWAELGVKGATGKNAVQAGTIPWPTTINPDGTAHFEPLVQEDGKTPLVVPEKEQEKVNDATQGTLQAINAIDKLRELRDENGGNWSNLSADAKLKVAEYERALIGMHKAAGISGFRGNVMEVMDKQLSGGADPTAVIVNVDKLLDNARDNLTQDYNDTLRTRGKYTGKAVTFPDPLKNKAIKTPEQMDFQDAIKFQPGATTTAEIYGDDLSKKLPAQVQTLAQERIAEQQGRELQPQDKLTPHVKQVVDTLAAASQGAKTPQERNDAAAMLLDLANKAVDPNMKAYAAAKLQEQAVPSLPESP